MLAKDKIIATKLFTIFLDAAGELVKQIGALKLCPFFLKLKIATFMMFIFVEFTYAMTDDFSIIGDFVNT